ncbi:MAG: FtsW/RodA/SpoVE family cell cycle protein [bacterium]|nr:FtsW/RodA/SpoVE family cell cycle protein [bacterium]
MLNRLLRMDHWLLVLIGLSAMAGILVILAASGSGGSLLFTRLKHLGFGCLLMIGVSLINYRLLKRLAFPVAIASVLILISVLFTTGSRGTRGWIPFFGITLQAVDVARVGLVVFMANRLAVASEEITFWRRFGWALGALTLFCLLVCLQPDFGSAMALGLTGAVILFIAHLPKRLFFAGGLILALLIVGGYLGSDRIRDRINLTVKYDPAVITDEGYQLRQSLIGIGAGGVTGQGAGRGRQKIFLPDHHTDFIYSIVGEEFGLLGTFSLLVLLSALALRVLSIAGRQVDLFARYLTTGVGGMLFIYSTLNIAVTLGLFPLTGVPLPFISHGGSALVMNLIALGMVLSISADSRKTETKRGRPQRERVVYENLFRQESR